MDYIVQLKENNFKFLRSVWDSDLRVSVTGGLSVIHDRMVNKEKVISSIRKEVSLKVLFYRDRYLDSKTNFLVLGTGLSV